MKSNSFLYLSFYFSYNLVFSEVYDDNLLLLQLQLLHSLPLELVLNGTGVSLLLRRSPLLETLTRESDLELSGVQRNLQQNECTLIFLPPFPPSNQNFFDRHLR